jgi:hypothetical protein
LLFLTVISSTIGVIAIVRKLCLRNLIVRDTHSNIKKHSLTLIYFTHLCSYPAIQVQHKHKTITFTSKTTLSLATESLLTSALIKAIQAQHKHKQEAFILKAKRPKENK